MTMTAKKLKMKEARKAIWSQTGMSCFSSMVAVVSVASEVTSPVVTLPAAVTVVPPVDVSATATVLSTTVICDPSKLQAKSLPVYVNSFCQH